MTMENRDCETIHLITPVKDFDAVEAIQVTL